MEMIKRSVVVIVEEEEGWIGRVQNIFRAVKLNCTIPEW